ncbi:MAG: NAD(P)-dependent oxidoreductase [Clostridiales bacterium]|nr:NAD(P)-dependent oxidoreductase [Clostridiales bacterium]
MKRIILTGATGAIGTAIINECIRQNIEVLVLCRADSARKDNIPCSPLVMVRDCSLQEMAGLQNLDEEQYDAFIHLAWDGTVGAARNDMYTQNRNVRYALDAVELADRFGCGLFIGAGSQAEYGRTEGLLTAETPVFPEMGYGIAKLCAGHMTRERAHQLGMRHIWMRILSVYGPNDGEKSMISCVIRDLQNGVSPKCTLGEQKWDYLYSGDAARAFLAAAAKGKDGKTYVLGSGDVRPLHDYIEDIKNVVAPQIAVSYGAIPYAETQVMFLGADISEIHADTGWLPTCEFKKGIARIVETIGDKKV